MCELSAAAVHRALPSDTLFVKPLHAARVPACCTTVLPGWEFDVMQTKYSHIYTNGHTSLFWSFTSTFTCRNLRLNLKRLNFSPLWEVLWPVYTSDNSLDTGCLASYRFSEEYFSITPLDFLHIILRYTIIHRCIFLDYV